MTDFARDVIEASHRQPVLVDFHAPWCGPCRMLGPVLDQAVKQAPGALKLVKIDTDGESALAMAQGVSSIPDVRLFHQGQEVARFAGFRPLPQIQKWLAEHLAVAGSLAP